MPTVTLSIDEAVMHVVEKINRGARLDLVDANILEHAAKRLKQQREKIRILEQQPEGHPPI